MKDIKLGFAGLGCRGLGLLKDIVLQQKVNVVAACDEYEDRVSAAADAVAESGQERPSEYTDYRKMLADGKLNTIVIATAWESHTEIAVAAMEAGIAVALEVGGAYTVDQCFRLVDTYEKTKTPFMFLENCCFGRREMMVLNMVEKGLFGEIAHCSGCYGHDLRDEVSYGIKNRHYRFRNYLLRNTENYPTHELGPIAKILKINRGNRMLQLCSVASRAVGLKSYIKRNEPDDALLNNCNFAQGDVVTTVIKCARGETVVLTLDTTLPRFYSRGFTVRGTEGMYEEATDSVFLDREEDKEHDFDWRRYCVGNASDYEEEYDHPLWKEYMREGIQGTHDGMDWLEFKTFFDALRSDKPMPVDVYDAASWMVISALSEMSIAKGGAPIDIPDFTRGKWILRTGTKKEGFDL